MGAEADVAVLDLAALRAGARALLVFCVFG
jgi:hypothetical protein